MKKYLIAAGVVTFALVSSVPASASDIDWRKVGKFLGGVVSSVVIHEGSHYLVAKAEGIDIERDGTDWTSDKYSTTLQLAGLIGNAVSSEIVLLIPAERRGSFCSGLLMANAYEEIAYPTLGYNEKDFGNLEVTDSEKTLYTGVFLSHGALTLYRMHRADQLRPSFWFGRVQGAPGMGLTWNF